MHEQSSEESIRKIGHNEDAQAVWDGDQKQTSIYLRHDVIFCTCLHQNTIHEQRHGWETVTSPLTTFIEADPAADIEMFKCQWMTKLQIEEQMSWGFRIVLSLSDMF